MARVDLNSDLGESFGVWQLGDDAAMYPLITSANLACGFHAGDASIMLASCRAAAAHGVVVGAHPSYRDLAGFGRRDIEQPLDELHADVVYQVAALTGIAEHAGTAVRYLKPHGALYNRAAADPEVAEVIADVARVRGLLVLGLPGSAMAAACTRASVAFIAEAFVDRGYLADGTLAPRDLDGAVLTDAALIAERAVGMVTHGEVEAIDGSRVRVRPASLCVHGDTPGAVAIARAVRDALDAAGVELRAFAADSASER